MKGLEEARAAWDCHMIATAFGARDEAQRYLEKHFMLVERALMARCQELYEKPEKTR